ncbi:unnamed protein product, partial [Rotaria magnacalcarata]
MLFTCLSIILVCGFAFGDDYERNHTPAERMKILGPLAFGNTRLAFTCPALTASEKKPTSGFI